MSFFKRLFGFGGSKNQQDDSEQEPTAVLDYKGYVIRAFPQPDGEQYRLYGTITKEIDGQTCKYLLIRADVFSDKKDAADAMVRKAQLVIKEQGDRIFDEFIRNAETHLANRQETSE